MSSKVDMGPIQIWGTAGRFHGNPVHRNQPCKWPPTSNITLKELQWRNLTIMNYCTSYEVWEELGAELAKWASKTVIHKAQLGKQTTNMVTKAVIHPRLWSTEINTGDDCNYGDKSSHASTWRDKPLRPPHRSKSTLDMLAWDYFSDEMDLSPHMFHCSCLQCQPKGIPALFKFCQY